MRQVAVMVVLLFLCVPSIKAQDAQIDTVKVVTKGEFYPYGHTTFHPPFVCTIVGEIAYINGVQVLPGLTRPRPIVKPVPVRPEIQARFNLIERVGTRIDSLRRIGVPEAQITQQTAQLYRADSAVVDSVHAGSGNTLLVWWKGERRPSFEFVPSRPTTAPNFASERRQMLLAYALVLNTGGSLFIGEGGSTFNSQPSQSAQVHEDIEKATHMTAAEFAAGKWRGAILPADAAREFAGPMLLQ